MPRTARSRRMRWATEASLPRSVADRSSVIDMELFPPWSAIGDHRKAKQRLFYARCARPRKGSAAVTSICYTKMRGLQRQVGPILLDRRQTWAEDRLYVGATRSPRLPGRR